MDNQLNETIKLTQMSRGSGCGCKIAPAILEEILGAKVQGNNFPNLLVGNEHKDDAAVLELPGGICLISTTDFFTPIVNNPYDYGRIAAANALSDVYAMGGKPILALAIMGFPVDKLSSDVARQIIAGAKEICKTANIPLAGGHTIDSPEPVFGLAVNGIVKKENIRKNSTAKEGDVLILTKPLGTGILAAAHKRGLIKTADLERLIQVMTRLNVEGEKLGEISGVHAMTDVTGFGLLGHLIEMCEGSGLSANLVLNKIPVIEGVETYTKQFIVPDNTYRNWNSYEKKVNGINGPEFMILCDPQTSGGLLISAHPDSVNEITEALNQFSFTENCTVIGSMIPQSDSMIYIHQN